MIKIEAQTINTVVCCSRASSSRESRRSTHFRERNELSQTAFRTVSTTLGEVPSFEDQRQGEGSPVLKQVEENVEKEL